MPALLPALALALAATTFAPAPGRGASPQDGVPSLERVLAAARARRAEAFRRLMPEVEQLVGKLEILGRPRPAREIQALRQELDDLGPEAAPLLLLYLDPGLSPSPAALFRATEVRDALERIGTGALTDSLADLLATAGLEGRRNAAWLLGRSPDAARAGASLRALFPASKGSLRIALAEALVELGGEPNLAPVLEALSREDVTFASACLDALARKHRSDAAPAVAALLARGGPAKSLLPQLERYFAACPETIDDTVLLDLLDLIGDRDIPFEQRADLLAALGEWSLSWRAATRKRLQELTSSSVATLREGALVLLANLGDRSAKRKVLAPYEDAVEANPRYAKAYEARADLLMRLREYGDAARDYRKAVELSERGARFVDKELRVRLARAFALDGKAKPAYEALREANLARTRLQALAVDPDFEILREHSRYRKVFE